MTSSVRQRAVSLPRNRPTKAEHYFTIVITPKDAREREQAGFELAAYGHMIHRGQRAECTTLMGYGVVYMPDRSCVSFNDGVLTIVGRTVPHIKNTVEKLKLTWPGDGEVVDNYHHPAHLLS